MAKGHAEVIFQVSPDGEMVTLTLPVACAADMLEAASKSYTQIAGESVRNDLSAARTFARLAEHLIKVKGRIMSAHWVAKMPKSS